MARKILILEMCFLFGVSAAYYTNSDNYDMPHTTGQWSNATADSTTFENNKVNIKVYYETLCPASVDFFTSQLEPVVEKLSPYLEVHLVPYGHAKTRRIRGSYWFRCQHGPAECYGNKLHACAVDAMQNKTQAILFNTCLMKYTVYQAADGTYDYTSVLNWCGYKLKASIYGIWQCINSNRGSFLLKEYGVDTDQLRPHYVPYVVLDGSIDKQDQATGNLMATICDMLHPKPTACYGY